MKFEYPKYHPQSSAINPILRLANAAPFSISYNDILRFIIVESITVCSAIKSDCVLEEYAVPFQVFSLYNGIPRMEHAPKPGSGEVRIT